MGGRVSDEIVPFRIEIPERELADLEEDASQAEEHDDLRERLVQQGAGAERAPETAALA